jgi:hypothetical protein
LPFTVEDNARQRAQIASIGFAANSVKQRFFAAKPCLAVAVGVEFNLSLSLGKRQARLSFKDFLGL